MFKNVEKLSKRICAAESAGEEKKRLYQWLREPYLRTISDGRWTTLNLFTMNPDEPTIPQISNALVHAARLRLEQIPEVIGAYTRTLFLAKQSEIQQVLNANSNPQQRISP